MGIWADTKKKWEELEAKAAVGTQEIREKIGFHTAVELEAARKASPEQYKVMHEEKDVLVNSVNAIGHIIFSLILGWVITNLSVSFLSVAYVKEMYPNVPLIGIVYENRFWIISIVCFLVLLISKWKWSKGTMVIAIAILLLVGTLPSWGPSVWMWLVALIPDLNQLTCYIIPTGFGCDQTQKVGCTDCLTVSFNNPASAILEDQTSYTFSVNLKNEDCPVEEDPKTCTGKTLKNVKLVGKIFYEGDKDTFTGTTDVGDIGPGEEVSRTVTIDNIDATVYKENRFYLSLDDSYEIEATANAEIKIYAMATQRATGEKARTGITHAGPVDISLMFAPSEVSLQEMSGSSLPMELKFVLKETGTATIEEVKLIQYGSQDFRLPLESCSIPMSSSSTSTQEEYTFETANFYKLTSSYASEPIYCKFTVRGPAEPRTFAAEAKIKFEKGTSGGQVRIIGLPVSAIS